MVYAAPARTLAEQSVLAVLAFHAGRSPVRGDDGRLAYEAWPSVATIAREAGLKHRETARLVLRRLERAGRVERVKRHARTTIYRLPIPHREGEPSAVGGRALIPHPEWEGSPIGNGRELSVNDACKSSSDLSTRARASDEEGDDGMAELPDEGKARVRAALDVLTERALENEPDAYANRLAARAGQLIHLRDLTALAARHPHLTPEQLASWVDYAVAIGGEQGSAHDGPDDDG